jgi:hypothetical protein
MPVKKPTRKALAARRAARSATRAALMAALRSIREARKSVVKAGPFKPLTVDPIKYPPQPGGTPCKTPISTAITSKAVLLYPPRVPMFICWKLFPPRVPTGICGNPPKPIWVTREDFKLALDEIELWVRYLLKVYDKIYPKRPTPPKRKPRP